MIYFDLDNTLIDYNSSERKAIEFIFKEKYGLVLNNNQTDYWSKISRKYFDYYLSKQITFEEQEKNRFIKMLSYCGYVENEKIAMELFEEYQKQLENSWILFDDVVTKGNNMKAYFGFLTSNYNCKVLGGITLGRTEHEYHKTHPIEDILGTEEKPQTENKSIMDFFKDIYRC